MYMASGRSSRAVFLVAMAVLSLALYVFFTRPGLMALLGMALGAWVGSTLTVLLRDWMSGPEAGDDATLLPPQGEKPTGTQWAGPAREAPTPAGEPPLSQLKETRALPKRLHAEIRELDNLALLVEEGAASVKGGFVDVAGLVGRLNAEMEKLSGGVRKQARRYEEIGDLASQMAESTSNVSIKTEAMAASADQTLSSARLGAAAVSKSVAGMKAIRDSVLANAEKIRLLGDRSERIGEIVTVIGELADQTNLLALNAAIEAARAGEQGRGFAVVASEVRRLAERSNKAAKDIAQLLGDITRQTAEAIQSMERSTKQVEDGVVLADEAGKALGEIDRVVEQSASEIRFISENAVENAHRIEDLVRSMEDVAAITQENSDAIREMAEADWFSSVIRKTEAVAEEALARSRRARQKTAALLSEVRSEG